MRVVFFNTKPYDRESFSNTNRPFGHDLTFIEPHLSIETAILAADFPAICIFVNDSATAPVMEKLAAQGVRLIALRCAGFNNVDLTAAKRHDITVVRVPAYSPHAVAEHAIGLMLILNRKIHKAHARVHEQNFSLNGLLGFDMVGRTVGLIGTGRIGAVMAQILLGFGCHVIAYDPVENETCRALGIPYLPVEDVFKQSDIISLHCPLTPETHHLVNEDMLRQVKPGLMLINTSRGAVVDTQAVIQCLKSGRLGSFGLDVYEEEQDLFFEDLSNQVIQDDVFARLLTFPNVIITGHQAFFTREALEQIAKTTLQNISDFEAGRPLTNQVSEERLAVTAAR